ncbi:hypothetical protein CVT24_004048 [Panaeolus cyanescens]|uniref:Casein kinase II subunit beta n=1 Tax=Panaeolus cyanescens TaxID=181874 RepID=A0A409Y684_9AGAR|nr:hypothetical protein CVT24_004048 [Panaeolus cyanescens]
MGIHDSASSTPTSTLTWISWFCSLPGHEYFCEVTEDFIEDDFNLTGLNTLVPFWKEAMEMVLDVEPDEDTSKIPDVSIVESSAEMLYGLVHQRYILTRMGLQAMVRHSSVISGGLARANSVCDLFPSALCPIFGLTRQKNMKVAYLERVRVFIALVATSCLAGGLTFQEAIPSSSSAPTVTISTFHPAAGSKGLMVSAFFGTTFAHLFFQTYRELAPAPFWKAPSSGGGSPLSPKSPTGAGSKPTPPFANPNPHGGQKRAAGYVYVPRIYGFKVSERAKSGPRMQWLRLRPESPEELDSVDWRGRWINEDYDYDDDDQEEEEDRQMEDFDPDAAEGEEDDFEEEEEEEDAGPRPGHQEGPVATRTFGTSPVQSARTTAVDVRLPVLAEKLQDPGFIERTTKMGIDWSKFRNARGELIFDPQAAGSKVRMVHEWVPRADSQRA